MTVLMNLRLYIYIYNICVSLDWIDKHIDKLLDIDVYHLLDNIVYITLRTPIRDRWNSTII